MARRRKPSVQRPQTKTPNTSSFKVNIELDAVMEYMTLLRGLTAHGNFFPDLVSDELSRFPDFKGRAWEEKLPEGISFEDFLALAITGPNSGDVKFFDRVRPYDFALRELTFLQRKDTQITIYVPELFRPYASQVQSWLNEYFPDRGSYPKVRVKNLDLNSNPSKADAWVARDPKTIQWLLDSGQPTLVIDGQENKGFSNALRVIRWDQAGFVLRHARLISYLAHQFPEYKQGLYLPIGPVHPPHKNLWAGNRIVLLQADDASTWVSDQRSSLLYVLNNPDESLKYDPNRSKQKRTSLEYPDELKQRVLDISEQDLEEINRRVGVLRELVQEKFELIIEHPRWISILRGREETMREVLKDIEKELGIDPVTGGPESRRRPNVPRLAAVKDVTGRIINGSPDEPIILNLGGSDVIHILGRHFQDIDLDDFTGIADNHAGRLAEIVAIGLLKDNGWKFLTPRQPDNRPSIIERIAGPLYPHKNQEPISEQARIDITWTDRFSGEQKQAEVDFVAKGPKGIIAIGEVKLTSLRGLSETQIALREHLKAGGKLDNPGFPGVRSKTFSPIWREIRIDDGPFNGITPESSLAQMAPAPLSREL